MWFKPNNMIILRKTQPAIANEETIQPEIIQPERTMDEALKRTQELDSIFDDLLKRFKFSKYPYSNRDFIEYMDRIKRPYLADMARQRLEEHGRRFENASRNNRKRGR